MKKANKIEWTENLIIGQLDGSVTLDLHLRSEKGKCRAVRVTFDQHDVRSLILS